jgi:hypothetical protein
VRVEQSKEDEGRQASTRSFGISLISEIHFFCWWGGGRVVDVMFVLPAMGIVRNTQIYEIYFVVGLIHICSPNPPSFICTVISPHGCYFFVKVLGTVM